MVKALHWGCRDRRFKSGRPDHEVCVFRAGLISFPATSRRDVEIRYSGCTTLLWGRRVLAGNGVGPVVQVTNKTKRAGRRRADPSARSERASGVHRNNQMEAS